MQPAKCDPLASAARSRLSRDETLISEIQVLFLEKLSLTVESAETDLFEAGLLDSMVLVQIIFALDAQFGLELPMEELDIESFRSIVKIAELVRTHRCAWRTRYGLINA